MKSGALGEAIEIIQEEVEKGAKSVVQQITGKSGQKGSQGQQTPPPSQKPSSDQVKPQEAPEKIAQADETKAFVKDIYASQGPAPSEDEVRQKELEDKRKVEALRQKLHREYFERFIKPPKPKEERPAEKVEREEEEKKLAVEEEEKKKKQQELPIVVTKDMGTKEKLRGVSG